ncbi:lasso peptide biosynthesis PqqD family chaperone [Shewanella dokdonensis]|uniref:Lasso peptide biosynthesis PqqD family chaperone n=1 Tax=Shewanella dokdonensis TaxID=712036 RepID=A0ABX8DG49_9GAMM|nr:lasso peptide biosynthesis PqqD family chaperone [Shewanella dokdonensis]MCL1073822.1 lasso peptide biosynthesis PqqD family chaperone [Shewanella dokdonensis]QVK23608.1 lasso peptide biosynthesis PqqD family chaperone [Shewanella dokdonensis]
MSELTLDCELRRKPDQIFTDMDGDTVMMVPETGNYFGISGTGSRIWELLEAPQSIADIVEQICNEYDVTEQQCQQDTLIFCQSLVDNQLVDIQS